MEDRLIFAGADPPVIALPAEIDCTNAERAAADLALACVAGLRSVIADLTNTTFCDSSALRALLRARQLAASRGIELDLAVTTPAVLRVLELTGLTSILRLYPSVEAALSAARRPRAQSGGEPSA